MIAYWVNKQTGRVAAQTETGIFLSEFATRTEQYASLKPIFA